jgi:ribonuclease E
VLGEGRGRNKKEAEQAAARNALERVENGPISDRDSKRDDRTAVRPARGGAPASTSRVSEMESHVLPEPDLGESELSEDDDESGYRPRRRRGRRGGRGRRERGGEASPPAVTPAPAPVVGTAAATPVREPRARVAGTTVISPRPEPRRPARAAQEPPAPPRVELEPVPPAYEEDENEEIGRPEGTLAEWRESPSRPATTRPVPPAEWERAPERRPVEAPEAVAAGRDEIEDEFVESPLQPRRREVPVATPEREPEFEAEPEPVFEVEPERESAPRLAEEEFADEDVSPRYPEVEPPRATPPAPAAPAAPQWGRRSRRGR